MLQSFPADAIVCRQEELSEGLYVVRSGFAKEVVRAPQKDSEAAVQVLKPGDSHGLISLIDGQMCSTTLVTLQACEFLFIPRPTFVAELKEHPKVYRQALAHLCDDLRLADRWVAEQL